MRRDRSEPDDGWRVHPRIGRALTAGLIIAALVTFLAWGFLALVHVDDRYHVGWVEGSRIALTRSADSGVLYPPLYDGNAYGGTRFMPVPILLHAGLSRITGEYLVAGKLVAYLSSTLLLAAMFFLLRRAGCPLAAALALAAGVLVTLPGLLAATTVQGDALSVVFQLAAVGLIQRSTRSAATVGAAGLCTLAIVTKLSAVWAPLAIGTWLLLRHRQRLLVFAPALLLLLAASTALFQVLSDGRMLTNLQEVAFAGVGGPSGVLRSPTRILSLVADDAPLLLILVPFALAGAVLRGWRGMSLWFISLLWALLVLVVVMADAGALHNHLLDLIVLTLLVVGAVWAEVQPASGRTSVIGAILAVAVLWGVSSSLLLEVRPDVEQAIRARSDGTSPRYDPHPLAGTIAADDALLSEDPYIPVALGRRPVVLDAWMLLRFRRKHPGWISDLAARIEARQFDWIVLAYPLSFRGWYSEQHFGDEIAEAIRTGYRFDGRKDGYYLYAPARVAP